MGKHGKHKKSKKSSKEKRRAKSSSSSEEEWVEVCYSKNKGKESDDQKSEQSTLVGEPQSQKREEWMDLPTSFASISNVDLKDRRDRDKKLQKESERYDPSQSSRELNPYWKNGGGGMPVFKRPDDDSHQKYNSSRIRSSSSNWRKKDRSSSEIKSDAASGSKAGSNSDIISEKELNLLAGKLVKAEIMGNKDLADELKLKLDNARKAIETAKAEGKYEDVLLTQTDSQGRSKPLKQKSHFDESTGKQKRRKTETHKDNQRVKYFADDDKYSLKEMFEEEKYNTSNRQDEEFVKIVSNVRKNDDLDDLFADDIRRTKSDSKIDCLNKNRAVNEHKKMTKMLDTCNRCIQSEQTLKHLIVSMGEYVYLSLPPYEPLTTGHCCLVPVRHVSCSTQLDENEWAEIMDFRKALVKYCRSKNEETVFFECSMSFHKYPHMVIECIPMPKEEGEMAPIYFKKAIDESETEWAQNKKLVSLKGRDVRKAVPKGLPYFFVSFGLQEGYAHVIEDEKMFPRNFAQEIIGGMLDVHHSKWRKPQRQTFDDQSKRVSTFSAEWKDFDCTVNG